MPDPTVSAADHPEEMCTCRVPSGLECPVHHRTDAARALTSEDLDRLERLQQAPVLLVRSGEPAIPHRQIVLREDLAWLIRAARERDGYIRQLKEFLAEGSVEYVRSRHRILAEIEKMAERPGRKYEGTEFDHNGVVQRALAEARRRANEETR